MSAAHVLTLNKYALLFVAFTSHSISWCFKKNKKEIKVRHSKKSQSFENNQETQLSEHFRS